MTVEARNTEQAGEFRVCAGQSDFASRLPRSVQALEKIRAASVVDLLDAAKVQDQLFWSRSNQIADEPLQSVTFRPGDELMQSASDLQIHAPG